MTTLMMTMTVAVMAPMTTVIMMDIGTIKMPI
jgi:hypothetical protein